MKYVFFVMILFLSSCQAMLSKNFSQATKEKYPAVTPCDPVYSKYSVDTTDPGVVDSPHPDKDNLIYLGHLMVDSIYQPSALLPPITRSEYEQEEIFKKEVCENGGTHVFGKVGASGRVYRLESK